MRDPKQLKALGGSVRDDARHLNRSSELAMFAKTFEDCQTGIFAISGFVACCYALAKFKSNRDRDKRDRR